MKWAVAGAIIFLVGFVFNLGTLVFAMYALFGILFLTRWLAQRWAESPTATRECLQTVAELNDTVEVTIRVTNQGRLPIAWCLIEEQLPATALAGHGKQLWLEGPTAVVKRIQSGQTIEFQYRLHCRMRGYYQLGPLVFESGDMFGLFRKYRMLLEPVYLEVLPKTHVVEGYDIASRRPVGEIVMSHRLFEDPTRIAGVRQYRPGDAISRIHWHATARTNQLHSKIFEPSSVAGATLVVDFHADSFDPDKEPFRSELAITAAASIANVLFGLNEQIGLVSNGRDAADRIKTEGWRSDMRTREEARRSITMAQQGTRLQPVQVKTRKHPAQLDRVRHALARLELTDGMKLTELLFEMEGRLPRDASIIVILAHVDMQVGVALGQLRRQGYAITAVMITGDPEKFATLSGPLMAEGIETRMVIDEASVRDVCRRQLLHN